MRWIQAEEQGVGAIFKLVQDEISRVYPSYYPKNQNIVVIRGEDDRSESVLAACFGAVRSFLDTREKETSYGGDSRRLTRVSLGFGLVPHLYRKAWHALKLARVASDEHSPVGKGRGSDE